jgi:hypothetical protein
VSDALDPEPLLRALHDAGVRYVIIGGFAVNAHGVIRPSKDLDRAGLSQSVRAVLRRHVVLAASVDRTGARVGYGSVPIRAEAVVPTEPEPALTDDISDPGTGYLIASNETWELTQVIPMEYNRFVLYSSNIFHSPLYDERDFGSTLEARRLTQNFYFVKRSVGQ